LKRPRIREIFDEFLTKNGFENKKSHNYSIFKVNKFGKFDDIKKIVKNSPFQGSLPTNRWGFVL
jgi:hypothetical protein